MKVRAAAKTNLFLEVPRKRDDGFHELDTVFVALDLADELTFAPADSLQLVVEGGGPELQGPDNLVLRAAEALQSKVAEGRTLGARIHLRKEIPAGGGLGGGSSDAAATLRGLNALWDLGLSVRELEPLAADLGSDVAFFLRAGLQRGRGRGEILEPLPALPAELDLVLVFPEFGCPTPDVYRALAPYLSDAPRDAGHLIEALRVGPSAIARGCFNRLERPACELYPALDELRQGLLGHQEALGVILSGSGSTLVTICESEVAADRLTTKLRARGLRAQATRTASEPNLPLSAG